MTTPESLLQLAVSERIQLVEDLWDSIAADESQVPLTAEQLEELDRRLQSPSETTFSLDEERALARTRR